MAILLAFLADTAGAVTEKRFLQRVDYPNPRTFVGKGKLDEIKEYVENNDIGLVIFDDDLSTKQVANLERELQVKILDRTIRLRLPQYRQETQARQDIRWLWPRFAAVL